MSDPVQRVAAFWESVEFYVGDRGPEAQFADDEIAAIVERAASGLESDKAARVGNVLRQWVNVFSITARLHHVLAEEDVPVTADDYALLRRLRRHRNKAVHGSRAAPEQDDIDRAVAGRNSA